MASRTRVKKTKKSGKAVTEFYTAADVRAWGRKVGWIMVGPESVS